MSFDETTLEEPISFIVAAGTTVTTSFPQTFFRFASSIIITNLDAANVATYQINGESQPILTLAAGDFRTLNGIKVALITIVAGAAGAVQVQAIGRPIVQ